MVLLCEPLCHFGDRLYFTTFPHPPLPSDILNSLATESGNRPRVRPRPKVGVPSATPDDEASYYYFTVDDKLVYMSFFQDWGPLNIAMVYKACILIHELLEDSELSQHRLVLYSSNDPRRKANAALLMALYVMIVQRRAPWEAFHPIAELEFMPFRDAGRGPSDFSLNIQDCLWGVWKAMQNGLCDMNEFSVEDYEYYEKVENGDWNWITPHFIAFASPVDTHWVKKEKEAREKQQQDQQSPITASPSSKSTSSGTNLALQRKLPTAFVNCLDYFEKRNVKLVIRLNTALYDRNVFLDRGIDHMELYFDDGTNPTDEIVRTFIETVDKIIEAGGAIAVHCKAGLGRTGSLIGAYLIWKYGFTANEVIAFMRIVRPGCVVGPQQQYMYLKQLEWCKWAAIDETQKTRLKNVSPTPALVTPATPPAEADDDSDTMQTTTPSILPTSISLPPVTPSRHIANGTAKAMAIATPGQPRKAPQTKRVASDSDEEADDVLPALDIAPITRPRVKTSRVAGKITSSESRPTRVTRSTAGAAAIRKAGGTSTDTPMKGSQQGPNKIPRLATTRTTAAAKAAVTATPATRREPPPPPPSPPPPSRLPTLAKRVAANGLPDVGALKRPASAAANAWMKNNAAAVVVPATKSGRPGLRSVRKRRSSFSAADVIA